MKVKISDLRIGNLIDYDGECIKLDGSTLASYIQNELTFIFNSIPLKEELLLRLGAVKLDFKGYPSYNLKGMQINFINGMWIEYVSRIEITGLHHLQNIFYFRMSEELTIKAT